jgi:DNA-binding XRE family transcriptional regulator
MRAFYVGGIALAMLVRSSYLIRMARSSERRTPLIATRVKKLREAAGLSQEDLAGKARLSLSAICKIEQGKKPDPRVSTVQALAAALGVDCTALLGEVAGKGQKKVRCSIAADGLSKGAKKGIKG